MKKILLDYDNTICDFNRILVNKWKTLDGEYKDHEFKYEDITEYSLVNCLNAIGYTKEKAQELIDKFWDYDGLYQESYADAPHRKKVISLLKNLKKDKDNYIELNTICNTFVMANSKLKRLMSDKELLTYVDNIVINTCKTYWKLEKSHDYDIIIEDNPSYIINYLYKNKSGKIYMPIWNYNEYLIPNKRITPIYINKKNCNINIIQQIKNNKGRSL